MNFQNISAWSIRNPVIPLVFFTAILFAGIISFRYMDVVNNPDIEFPGVNINISQPGAAPTEIENQITQQIESAVRSINGVRNISSTAREGSSGTFVEFDLSIDPNVAVAEVKNAVDRARGSLPDGILEPQVNKVEVAGGFLGIYAVEATDMTIEQLSWFIDDTVSKRLLGIEGMAEAGRWGGVSREIEVILDLPRMQSLGVTASQINQLLRQDNIDAAGGLAEVGGTRQSVRVLGNTETAYELSQRQLRLGNGTVIKLADVARVKDGFSERTTISKVRDKEVVNFFMSRAKGASDLAVYEEAQTIISDIEAENPSVKFIPLFNTVQYTEDQYTSSISAMVEGAVLAVIVVFFFLRDWRATFISAVAIPLSAIPTFWFMDLLGFNLNQMSLLALGLVAGVLVDDAIVEIENIVRHMRMGKTAYQASIDAADEIGLPVVATSFCIVAVFFPVALMPGITGQFFKNFGLTVVIAVLMSLAVARMITPLLAAYFLRADGHATHGEGKWMDRYLRVLDWSLDRSTMLAMRAGLPEMRYRWMYNLCLLVVFLLLLVATAVGMFGAFWVFEQAALPEKLAGLVTAEEGSLVWSLVARPLQVLQLAAVCLAGFVLVILTLMLLRFLFRLLGGRNADGWQYLEARFHDHRVWMLGLGYIAFLLTIQLGGQTPFQVFPDVDDDNIRVEIEMVPGTTIETTERVTKQVTDLLYSQDEVEIALERVRQGAATIFVTLKDDRERKSFVFTRDIAPELAKIPDARVRFQTDNGPGGGGSGRDFTIMLAGSNPELLSETANKVVEEMKALDAVVAPRITADIPRPEIIIRPRTELLADLGVSTIALSQTIRIATLGEIEQNSAKFSLADRQVPISVKLPASAREDLGTIEGLPVPTNNGGSVPLGSIADISFGAGPTSIQRYNQNRRVFIGADLAQDVLRGDANIEIEKLPTLNDLPAGVIRDAVGTAEFEAELASSFQTAIIAGVLLVFAVLVLLYKRLMSPLVNMTSLALAPLGGIFLIWIVGEALSMPVLIGVLLLLGIVSKNSILLIDFAIEAMDAGVEKYEAIMDAGHKRAQPIVMTTVAMTAGMVPTALSISGDGAWRAPMGVVVIGGLILSTLLTLVIVPAGFSLADGFERRVGPWMRRTMLTYKPGDDTKPYGPSDDGPSDDPDPHVPFPGQVAIPASRHPPGAEPAE